MQGCGVSEIGVRGVTETKGSQKVHQECTFYKTDTLSSAATADVVKCLPEKMATIVAGWRDWLRGGLSAVSGGDEGADDYGGEAAGVVRKANDRITQVFALDDLAALMTMRRGPAFQHPSQYFCGRSFAPQTQNRR